MKQPLPLFFLAILCMSAHPAFTQQQGALAPSAYKTMVIPYTKPGEKISAVLAKSQTMRMIILELQSQLVSSGYAIEDFSTVHQNFLADKVLKESVSDSKAMLLDYADPDIYIELDLKVERCTQSNMMRAVVTLKPWLTATDHLLAPIVCTGNCFQQVRDSFDLCKQAIKMNWDDFNLTLGRSLDQIAQYGQPVNLTISVADKVGFDFNTIVSLENGEEMALSEAIGYWLDTRPKGAGYRLRGSTSQRLPYEDVRLPLIDERTQRFYTGQNLVREFRQFFGKLRSSAWATPSKVVIEPTIVGSKIAITLR